MREYNIDPERHLLSPDEFQAQQDAEIARLFPELSGLETYNVNDGNTSSSHSAPFNSFADRAAGLPSNIPIHDFVDNYASSKDLPLGQVNEALQNIEAVREEFKDPVIENSLYGVDYLLRKFGFRE